MLEKVAKGRMSEVHERFLGFESFFHAHAMIEDNSLFPFLRDELKLSSEALLLLGEHKNLLEVMDSVSADLKHLKEQNFKGPTFMIYTKLREVETLLFQHLSDEEKIVIDIILIHGWKGVVDDGKLDPNLKSETK
jgi:hemerythrin-like domain-containing protein